MRSLLRNVSQSLRNGAVYQEESDYNAPTTACGRRIEHYEGFIL
jgi:hypothetical protein